MTKTYTDKNGKTIHVKPFGNTGKMEVEHIHPTHNRDTYYYFDSESELADHLKKYGAK